MSPATWDSAEGRPLDGVRERLDERDREDERARRRSPWTIVGACRALKAAGAEYDGRRKMFTVGGDDYVTMQALKARPHVIGELALALISARRDAEAE